MARKGSTISVALATFNEAGNLRSCLDAVQPWVDEIIVVDGGSTDQTAEIARGYNAKVIVTDNPAIFHINKQKALDGCSGNWILQLDADEIVDGLLKDEILEIISKKESKNGYYIPRKNYFMGRWLSKGGQYPDFVIRLFRNGKGVFPAKNVHEQIVIEGPVGYLTNPLLHYTSKTLKDYWRKADAYTSLTAKNMKDRGIKKSIGSFIYYMVWKPLQTFFMLFFRHKGFVDGFSGFQFALFSSLHYPISYNKYLKDAVNGV